MIHLNVAQAKTRLSDCLDRVLAGETIVICKRNVPIAELRPLASAPQRPRVFGQDVGCVVVKPEFFEPLHEDEMALWTGDGPPSR